MTTTISCPMPVLSEGDAFSEPSTVERSKRPIGIRLAYLVSEYPALSHTFIENEIHSLEAAGHEVNVISVRRPGRPLRQSGWFRRESNRTRYLLEQLPVRILPDSLSLLVRNPRALWRLLRRWKTVAKAQLNRPVAVVAYLLESIVLLGAMRRAGLRHIHNHFGNAAGTVTWIAAATGEIDYSLSIHGPDIFYDTKRELLAEKLDDARFVRAIGHFCHSQLLLFSSADSWSRFSIVRCGVDVDKFSKINRLPLPKTELLCVGRLVPAKGQRILVEACAELRRLGRSFHLTLVGGGPDEGDLGILVRSLGLEETVTLVGGVEPRAVRGYYARADVFVLPSFAEGIPVVLMEAMACGLPVVATPIAGIVELIDHGSSGLLAEPGSVGSLANCLDALMSSPIKRERMGESGRRKVSQQYNLRRNGEAMAELFVRRLGQAA